MSVDKLVDSTQLDADLTSVANAIRAKGGTSAQLAFPAGFVSAIQSIPAGGGGLPATHIKTLTVPENVNAFQFEYDSTMASYDYVFMVMDFELTSSDWLYYSAAGGTERYGYQLLNHKFVLFKFLNGGNIINLCIPSYNASSSSPASPMIIPSVGSMVKIRCYNANKYIKAGSTLDIWGMNNADF